MVDFFESFDQKCHGAIKSVLYKFQDHSKPIVSTSTMEDLLQQAPKVFGDFWELMCQICGVNENLSRKKDRTEIKKMQVLFEITNIAYISNRTRLPFWAMIENISSMAHGVGHVAESANAFFGHMVSSQTWRH